MVVEHWQRDGEPLVPKLEAEGKSDRAAGKVQNAVGGLRDKLRGK